MPGVEYISLPAVAALVRARRKDFIVIDVRTSDYQGGHIPGCLNISSRLFDSNNSVRSIITEHILPRVERDGLNLVVTHCMRSQFRGPFAAEALAAHPLFPHDKVQVKVMDGGYKAWRARFFGTSEQGDMIEGAGQRIDASKVDGVRVVSQEDARKDAQDGWQDVDGVEEMHSVEIRTGKRDHKTQ